MTLSIITLLASYRMPSLITANQAKINTLDANTVKPKDDPMTNEADNWHKLGSYDTNMQGELHANLLRNNGITVSLQPLSAIPGMNSGIILWVEKTDLAQAQRILDGVDSDGASLLAQMSDAELGIVLDSQVSKGNINNGGIL